MFFLRRFPVLVPVLMQVLVVVMAALSIGFILGWAGNEELKTPTATATAVAEKTPTATPRSTAEWDKPFIASSCSNTREAPLLQEALVKAELPRSSFGMPETVRQSGYYLQDEFIL